MGRCEDSADELDGGHREVHAHSVSGKPQLLFDLSRVPVAHGPEGADNARSLGMVAVLARLSATLAGADFALDDDGPRPVDDIGLE